MKIFLSIVLMVFGMFALYIACWAAGNPERGWQWHTFADWILGCISLLLAGTGAIRFCFEFVALKG